MTKVYVLTDCAAEDNYTPRVFSKKEDAVKALKEQYNVYVKGNRGAIDEKELYNTRAEIFYVDDTYNILEVFEVEVK